MKSKRITVIGDGGWGTAVGLLAHAGGAQVSIWGAFPDYVAVQKKTRRNPRFLPGVKLPKGIAYHDDLAEAVEGADLWISGVPTPFLRPVMTRLAEATALRRPVVSLSKGVEAKTLLRPSQILKDVLGRVSVAILSGPSHAEEVARGLPAAVSVASRNQPLAAAVQKRLSGPTFRVYTNTDPIGVELGGALKNVMAIAGGICDGLGFGDNTKAALITRGLHELTNIAVALGAKRKTFTGLAGVGDLVTTCVSPHGRNRAVGEALGRGKKIAQILKGMHAVPEGGHSAASVQQLARRHKVKHPITNAVCRILHENADPKKEVVALMTRKLISE